MQSPSLITDPVFRATSQIEYNNAVITKTEGEIKNCEEELQKLRDIVMTDGGNDALGVTANPGLWKSSAVKERAKWLLDKMGKSVEKLNILEKDNAEMVKGLSNGHP